MTKLLYRLSIAGLIFYTAFTYWININPSRYQIGFNESRLDLRLPIIPADWEPRTDNMDAVYQKWSKPSTDSIGHFAKYISCDNWTNTIKAEIDIYGIINRDGRIEIISIMFDYSKEKWTCFRKKHISSNIIEAKEVFGYLWSPFNLDGYLLDFSWQT